MSYAHTVDLFIIIYSTTPPTPSQTRSNDILQKLRLRVSHSIWLRSEIVTSSSLVDALNLANPRPDETVLNSLPLDITLEHGCYIDLSAGSSDPLKLDSRVIEFAREYGFVYPESLDEDAQNPWEVITALSRDALDFLNEHTDDNHLWVVEDNSLFLQEVEAPV